MKRLHLLALGPALLLAACGDSKLSSGDEPANTGTGLVLTSVNAQSAVVIAFNAAMDSADLADVGGAIGVTATAPGSSSKATPRKQLSGFLVSALQQVPFGPDVFPCDVSGSITMSGDLADPFTLTAGDTFNIDAAACDDGLGEVLDGVMSMTVTEFTGDLFLQAYLLGMNASLNGLQVTTATDVVSSTGDTSVVLDTTATPFVSAIVSGASMMTSSNSDSETLSNYRTEQTVDAGQQGIPYTLTSSGTVDSSLLSDTVRYTTPVQFTGFDVDFPSTGELLVSGNNSSVRLVALDNVNVRIDLDNDGNGTVDESIQTTWLALAN
ncbi:MAG: hypothetical protein MUO51_00635 [Woeseiaceae bacterium]|nr:hypothetical protein [Woeseiaceae bacterium]